MSLIKKLHAREVLDSRGNPTIQVEVWSEFGYGLALVPSGASTGDLEAHELRDKGTEFESNWFGGKGVMTAVNNVNTEIAELLVENFDVTNQRAIDMAMIKLDGTKNKKRLGANAILGVSIAVLKAAADELDMPLYRYIGGTNSRKLPLPMLNVINGGEHASNSLDFQEFMIMPVGASTLREALQMANKVFHTLAKLLKEEGHSTAVGDEGGFAPNFERGHDEALEFLVKAIKTAGFNPAKEGEKAIAIAMDPATSELFDADKGIYTFAKAQKFGLEGKTVFTSDEMVDYLVDLTERFPIISIEDGLAETDWEGFKKFTAATVGKLQVVGDDLTVTNQEILAYAIKEKSMNSILIKINQIGSISETMDTIELAHKAGMTAVVSHRSGETEDTTIADLAVGLNTGQIKTGSMSRTDRIAKYNRLLSIEEELGELATFDGAKSFHNLGLNVVDAQAPSREDAVKHDKAQ